MPNSKPNPSDILNVIARAAGVSASIVRRYAASSQSRTATNTRSWLDKLWHMIWGTQSHRQGNGGYKIPQATINQLTSLLGTPEGRVALGGGSGGSSGNRIGNGPSSKNEEGNGRSSFPRPMVQRSPPTEAEKSRWSAEIFAPQSSNVYSFQYHEPAHRETGVLYVTYRAPLLDSESLSYGRGNAAGVTGKRQLIGKLGSTHKSGARPNAPGPKYAYSNVPKKVFFEMQAAAQAGGSVGKKVWDKLRIRHTNFGHKFPYALVSPSVHAETGQEYIPRKATANGFASRTVHAGGRWNFKTSTLAPSQTGQGGFTTRKPRK